MTSYAAVRWQGLPVRRRLNRAPATTDNSPPTHRLPAPRGRCALDHAPPRRSRDTGLLAIGGQILVAKRAGRSGGEIYPRQPIPGPNAHAIGRDSTVRECPALRGGAAQVAFGPLASRPGLAVRGA